MSEQTKSLTMTTQVLAKRKETVAGLVEYSFESTYYVTFKEIGELEVSHYWQYEQLKEGDVVLLTYSPRTRTVESIRDERGVLLRRTVWNIYLESTVLGFLVGFPVAVLADIAAGCVVGLGTAVVSVLLLSRRKES